MEKISHLKVSKFNIKMLKLALQISQDSNCPGRQVGAVITHGQKVLLTGFNMSHIGGGDCATEGCIRRRKGYASGQGTDICRAVHAEENVIAQAAKKGISVEGATIYITVSPCNKCARLIAAAGIKRVIVGGIYPNPEWETILKHEKVKIRVIEYRR